jgi:hypothetical protein
MRFPNLVWAIRDRRLAHYEVAHRVRMEPTRFSRCLSGRLDFAPHERKRIAEILGFGEGWLFCEPRPAPLTESETVEITSTRSARDA